MSRDRARMHVCGAVGVVAHLLGYARVSARPARSPRRSGAATTGPAGRGATPPACPPAAAAPRPHRAAAADQAPPPPGRSRPSITPPRSARRRAGPGSARSSRGVGFPSLRESIDTTTAGGRLVFTCSGRWPSSSGRSSGTGRWRRRGPVAGSGVGRPSCPRSSDGRPGRCTRSESSRSNRSEPCLG